MCSVVLNYSFFRQFVQRCLNWCLSSEIPLMRSPAEYWILLVAFFPWYSLKLWKYSPECVITGSLQNISTFCPFRRMSFTDQKMKKWLMDEWLSRTSWLLFYIFCTFLCFSLTNTSQEWLIVSLQLCTCQNVDNKLENVGFQYFFFCKSEGDVYLTVLMTVLGLTCHLCK